MNKNEAQKKHDELLAEAYWRDRNPHWYVDKQDKFVIRVFDEEHEPLFWHNKDGWINDPEQAQIYEKEDVKKGWVPFYSKDIQAHYILFQLGVASFIRYRLTHNLYEPERNERGNIVLRGFRHFDDNYGVESFASEVIEKHGKYPESWHHISTCQDAGYFGYWYSARDRILANYAEGDKTIVICEDPEHFMAEMIEFDRWCREDMQDERYMNFVEQGFFDLKAIQKEAEENMMWEEHGKENTL